VSDDLAAARAEYRRQRDENYERGLHDGIAKGDSRTTIATVCGVSAVLLGLFGAIMVSSVISSRAIVEQTQIACAGDLTEPARAIACAQATRKTP
jgi:hypothetical protein